MAGLIPQSFIDDLLARADIVDVVGTHVQLRKTGKNYSGLCPFHQEKSPSFTVEPGKQFYYCFGCGAGGNTLGFIMNYESLEFPQAIESLAATMGVDVPYEESPEYQKKREIKQTLYDTMAKAAQYYQQQLRQHPNKQPAISYLKSRGLSGEVARDFGLGFAPPGWDNLLKNIGTSEESTRHLAEGGMLVEKDKSKGTKTDNQHSRAYYDRFRERIIYPIKDSRGRVIGFGGRVLGDDKPKYLNSPETPIFRKGEELYGLYEAKKKVRKLERILIVEGYMDVIALAQHELNYAVATLGTATSSSHLQRLFKIVSEVVFCFDGDEAGRKAAWRALEQTMPLMKDGLTARFLFLPDGEDPDTQIRKTGKQSFERAILECTQLAEFFFESLGSQVDLQSLEGRAKLSSLALPLIQTVPDGVYKQLLMNQLANITGTNTASLQSIGQTQPPPSSAPPPSTTKTQNTSSPSAAARPKRHNSELSASMKAVNLILLNPSMVANHEHKDLEQVQAPDINLLSKVITLAQQYPGSSTPELLGRIYATAVGSQLMQLANREQITPKEGVEEEYSEIIQNLLKRQAKKQNVNALLQEARSRLESKHQHSNQVSELPESDLNPDSNH